MTGVAYENPVPGINARTVGLTVFFVLCLWPLSITVAGQGISANYSFMALPLYYALTRLAFRKPPDIYLVMIVVYSAILVLATAYQFDFLDHFVRRLISFVLFLAIFSYMFIRMDAEMLVAFKLAIVGLSVYFSADRLVTYIAAGGASLGARGQYIVGSQRFGFIYVLAIWLVYQGKAPGRLWRVVRYPVLFLLLLGLLLTFSRSGIVAVLGSFALFGLFQMVGWVRHASVLAIRQGLVSIVVVGAIGYGVIRVLPGAAAFFEERLFVFFLDNRQVAENLATTESSEGYRLALFRDILEFVSRNPLTGSGYLGVWVLSPDLSGSAHNQYMDVLFRTGVIGFACYIFLISRLLKYLYVYEKPLFWGLIGVLIYGLVHETFKESHGAFAFAFLLGLMSTRRATHSMPGPHNALVNRTA